MIGFSFYYGKRPVKLLDKQKPYHLMGESHSAYRKPLIASLIHLIRKAERPSDDKCQRSDRGIHLFLQVLRELHARKLFALFVQQHHPVRLCRLFEYHLGFPVFQFPDRNALRILHIGQNDQLEAHIMLQSFEINIHSLAKIPLFALSDHYKLYVHFFKDFKKVYNPE